MRRSAVAGGEDRRLGELQSGDDTRIAFLAELGLKRRQRLCVVGPEYVLGRSEALFRVGIGEGQRPHRAFDGASKRVIDADLFECGRVDALNGLAGLGVEKHAGDRLVGHEMIGGIDQQAIVAERLQNCCGLRRRLGRQFADRSLGLRKFVVEKFRQCVVDRVGAGGGREREQRQDAERTQGA